MIVPQIASFLSLIVCFETKQHASAELSFLANALKRSGGDRGFPQYVMRIVAVIRADSAKGEGTLKPGSSRTLE